MLEKNHYQSHKDLLEIIRGYSKLDFLEKTYYFRHFTVEEMLEVEVFMERDIASSVKSGIETQDKLLEAAVKSGAWSEEKEGKIKSLKWMIKKSTAALNKMQDVNQRKVFNEQIEEQRKDLKVLTTKKNKLIAYSAEALAETKKVSKLLDLALFRDLDFTEALEEKERLSLAPILFRRYAEMGTRENILTVSYEAGFFDMFVAQHRNPIALFNTSFREITIFQKNLLCISSGLLTKMKNTTIPDEIAGDPIKIMDYEEKEETQANVSHGIDDLKAKTKVRGGKLKAEDFLS